MLRRGQKTLLTTNRKVCWHQICIVERAQYDSSTTNLYMCRRIPTLFGGKTDKMRYGSLKIPQSALRLLKGTHRRKSCQSALRLLKGSHRSSEEPRSAAPEVLGFVTRRASSAVPRGFVTAPPSRLTHPTAVRRPAPPASPPAPASPCCAASGCPSAGCCGWTGWSFASEGGGG